MISNGVGFIELSHTELESINGGVVPLAVPVAALLLTAFGLGYNIGKDLANNKK